MIAAVLVPLEKYLATVYRPDCDYVDGRLEKRNVGKFEHSELQRALIFYLTLHAERFRCWPLPEMRVKVAPNKYRVADICCVRRRPAAAGAEAGIVTDPPALVIEILSPEDTVPQTEERIENYLAMGVPFCWLINPRKLDRAYIYEPDQPRRKVTDGILAAGEISLNLFELPGFEDFE